MAKESIGKRVTDKVGALEVNDTLDKKECIVEIYGIFDYFVSRSFDVMFSAAKKKFPERSFKTTKGIVKRLA